MRIEPLLVLLAACGSETATDLADASSGDGIGLDAPAQRIPSCP